MTRAKASGGSTLGWPWRTIAPPPRAAAARSRARAASAAGSWRGGGSGGGEGCILCGTRGPVDRWGDGRSREGTQLLPQRICPAKDRTLSMDDSMIGNSSPPSPSGSRSPCDRRVWDVRGGRGNATFLCPPFLCLPFLTPPTWELPKTASLSTDTASMPTAVLSPGGSPWSKKLQPSSVLRT